MASDTDAAFVGRIVDRVSDELHARADPDRAVAMAAYMRDQFAFLGVPAPEQKDAAKEALHGARPPSVTELAAVATALWDCPEREHQYVAVAFVNRHVGRCDATFLSTLEALIRTKSWWDTVDGLAVRAVGSLVERHPELGATMDAWIADDDRWIARSSLLHQNRFRHRTDRDRLFTACRQAAARDDPFVQKAIGWALREYSKSAPDAVEQFVTAEQATLSRVVAGEALRWVSRTSA